MFANALDVSPGDDDAVLQEQAAALQLLSNPMDLTYAAELIAQGQDPRPSQVVGQAYGLARGRYRQMQNRDFPIARFAERTVKLRREDRNWLTAEEFPAEQGVLLEYRLLVSRQLKATAADKDDVTIQRFRHDKVMDVLMKPACDGNDALQEELIDDPRFRGVYLLFAQAADREVGRKLRDLLVSRAAQTGDNGLSNEFVRRFDLAAPSRKQARQAA